MAKVAINGLGRIGRATLKVLLENTDLELVAVNDVVPTYNLAYLLNFDSVYGKIQKRVGNDEYHLYVNNRQIRVFNTNDPAQLPWRDMGVDIVFECTGKFTRKEDLEKHLYAGAKHVIMSIPSQNEDIVTIISGVNSPEGERELQIVSTGSCSANCITPIMEIISRRIGIKKAIVTTLNSFTESLSITDKPNSDLRRGRAGTNNFIPTSSEAAATTTKVLPHLKNRLNTLAVQAPVSIGSIADITIVTERNTSVEEINGIFSQESGSQRYVGIVAVNTEPIVSSDIMMDPRASVVDLTMTQVVDGDLVKIMSWYDNEWGFVNQMIREARRISQLEMKAVEFELA